MSAIIVYDNHIMPDVFIRNIVGEKTFGEIIRKRVSIKERFLKDLADTGFEGEIAEYDHSWQLEDIKKRIRGYAGQSRILHIFSCRMLKDDAKETLKILWEKAGYALENYVVRDDNKGLVGFIMKDIEDYTEFLEIAGDDIRNDEIYKKYRFAFGEITVEGFYDLSVFSNFQNYITGSFDTRFFNSVSGDEYVVKKTSDNKEKIKREYEFYGLLPDEMKPWFVQPYDYREDEKTASYSMKRYHMTDLALRWVHGAIDMAEFDKLMEILFYFLKHRAVREIADTEYAERRDRLYLTKVRDRITDLKKHPDYEKVNALSRCGNREYIDILLERYEELYSRQCSRMKFESISVVGHGDLCFSNMLFDKNTELLMLIDPKGALNEAEIWTDPYYDIAKLSHSICGMYDLFNNGLYSLDIDDDLKPRLEIDFDNREYEKRFEACLTENGFDVRAVRIFEVSLFLSMLPLHMDYPKKVFGFMKNAERIMDETEGSMK